MPLRSQQVNNFYCYRNHRPVSVCKQTTSLLLQANFNRHVLKICSCLSVLEVRVHHHRPFTSTFSLKLFLIVVKTTLIDLFESPCNIWNTNKCSVLQTVSCPQENKNCNFTVTTCFNISQKFICTLSPPKGYNFKSA